MHFFVIGCNGMAGHMISIYLKENGHTVLGFARKDQRHVPCIVGNVYDTKLLSSIVSSSKFDYIINCIGLLNTDAEKNKADAVYLNAYFPHFLTELTRQTETRVIHISTDCVFSGKKGSYKVDDFRDGETFYDRSKALGEIQDSKNITLRNSIIGPDINSNGIGLLNWFLQQKNTINGYTGSIWTGQTTLQLAKTIEFIAIHHITGIYNSVPQSIISKFDLLRLFNIYFKSSIINVLPIEGVKADKSLIPSKFPFDYCIPDYEQMIQELAIWLYDHKNIYPHYDLSKIKK
jgi:dTDP-4-dehydrorhamnose reductase